ncbi:MAG: nickel-dependent lactate racemase family protein [Chloroflexota bacterium]
MHIEYPHYAWAPTLEVPDDQFVALLEPRVLQAEGDVHDLLSQALARPCGAKPLSESLRPGQRLVIISDDVTRFTPAHLLLPPLLEHIEGAGVRRDDIVVMIGYGTHRPMTSAEKEQKLGARIVNRYRVEDHNAWDKANLCYRGTTELGTPIWINRTVTEADFVIGLGNIAPHPLAGFSGGAKILQPGVCGEETTSRTHWLGLKYRQADLLGRVDNPVRQEINQVALQAGLRFIVNTVQDRAGNLLAVVAGHPVQAWLSGCATAREAYGVPVPPPVDIVITDTSPADIDVWQCQKGINNAASLVRPGGTVIVLSPCPEGVASQYPDVLRVGPRPLAFLDVLVKRVNVNPMIGLALVRLHEATAERVVTMSSPGLDDDTCIRLGMVPYRNPQMAVEDALARHGPGARILALRHAAEVLPIRTG